ncbi:MAG: FMN-binding protein [Peptoniphilaceae bacterium]|nr:FMN-binding protein [Peptoniphilaceae bacterium]MDY6085268.1 FMN-binding protein [Peptoniphilaceae bacterium]
MKKSLILALKLFAICFVSTIVLALTNQATAPVIAEAQKQKEIAAFSAVFPELEEVRPVEDTSVLNDNITAVNEAVVGGETAGYLYSVVSPSGYDGPITFVVGATLDGTVTGLSVINQTETKGFGAAVADPPYAEGMKGVMLTGSLKAEGEEAGEGTMPAITGATRTSTAMERAMNMVVEAQAKLTGTEVDTSTPMTEVTDEQLQAAYPNATFEPLDGAPVDERVRAVYEATVDGAVAGHVFHVTEPEGFLGSIEFLIGVDNDGTIAGFNMIQQGESPEYGGVIAKPEYAEAMVGMALADKPGAITGATFTTEGMNKALSAVLAVQEKLGK